MIIYNYVEMIWRIIVILDLLYNIYNLEKNSDKPVNIHIPSLIDILNRIPMDQLPPKKVKGKLTLFFGIGERVITIYAETWKHYFHNYNQTPS